ncbi:MAG: isocitrate/isopropylmalate dehydrogenase family protein [Clostridiales bacterium]|nr:isocitrate/isopropylmalate dehydrogenase family protein [Clostridiales bacterium]
MRTVTLIRGDGIGPEIIESTKEVVASTGVNIIWEEFDAGIKSFEKSGTVLPDELIKSIEKNKIALKGPITTPIGEGFRSINVLLRQKFETFANVRPVKSFRGVDSKFKNVDMVVIRENTEDLYAGIEHKISNYAAESIKLITREASRRIADYAFSFAAKNNRKKVTAVHKANIMKLTDGLFLEEARKVAKEYSNIEYEEVIIDNMCMQMVLKPEKYDVLLCPNLYGDILSDLAAGLVGGLGVVPSANLGKVAIFEAVHGSAPDIAGKNIANPIAIILSAAFMLEYIGNEYEANLIKKAVEKVLEDGKYLTPDLGGTATTNMMTNELIKIIQSIRSEDNWRKNNC